MVNYHRGPIFGELFHSGEPVWEGLILTFMAPIGEPV